MTWFLVILGLCLATLGAFKCFKAEAANIDDGTSAMWCAMSICGALVCVVSLIAGVS